MLRSCFKEQAPAICISAITYAELRYGVARSVRREHNAEELDAFRRDLDIMPFDEDAGTH